jgi:hypothetical protein
MIDIRQGDVYSSRKEKAAFEELKKFGVTKDIVKETDGVRGLLAITFEVQGP